MRPAPCDAHQRNSIGEHLTDRIQEDLDASDLAWQRIARQHSLAVPAAAEARQRHSKRYKSVVGLEPSLDPTASKPEIALVACSAPTIGAELIAGTVSDPE